MLLFSPEPSHEDLRDFMDDEERREWDSGTSQQQENISKYLTAIWQSIPDPSEAELQQLMRPEDWQVCQSAPRNRDGIVNFYRRKWKKDRKTVAAANLSERIQVETIVREPKPPNKPRDPQLQAHEAALERQEQERQRKYEEERGKPIGRPDYGPPMSRLTLKALDLRRRLEEEYGDNPEKAALLPPANAPVQDLHKWYEDMSKPQGRPDYGSPPKAPHNVSIPLLGPPISRDFRFLG